MADPRLKELTADGAFRAKVALTLQSLEDQGEDPRIFETLRTIEQQRHKVRLGLSKTMRSYHLKKGSDGGAKAADIAGRLAGWNVAARFWLLLGANCEARALGWGGLFGLNADQKQALKRIFTALQLTHWPQDSAIYHSKLPIGWDPAHVQTETNW